MDKESFTGFLVSDFNTQNLASFLQQDSSVPKVRCVSAAFGQVIPPLMKMAQGATQAFDFVTVWAQPESVFLSFKKALEHESFSPAEVLEEVESFASLLVQVLRRTKFIFVPAWILPSYRRDFGLLEMQSENGISNLLSRMNLTLAQ